MDPKTTWRKARSVRFLDEEWKLLKERARAAGMQRGRYIRETAMGAVPQKSLPPIGSGKSLEKQLLHQLARIGNNLNQLARHANEGQPLPQSEIRQCLDQLNAAAKRIL